MAERKKESGDMDFLESGEISDLIRLSKRDQEAFVKAMLNPPPPSEKLIKAWQWYREQKGETSGSD